MLSDAIILGEEIGAVPVEDLPLRFLLRMDVELVEDHQLLVLQVVERPLLGFAVGQSELSSDVRQQAVRRQKEYPYRQ